MARPKPPLSVPVLWYTLEVERQFEEVGIVSGLEALQSVQFVTLDGRRLAVMDGGDWDALVEWLENIEDVYAARQAYQLLKEAGGDRDKAGWLRWDEIEGELD